MIDTLSMAADLAAAGIDKKQAEAHAKVIAYAVEQQYGEVATKDFVRSEISAAKFAVICWVVGTNIAIAALSVTILGLWIG